MLLACSYLEGDKDKDIPPLKFVTAENNLKPAHGDMRWVCPFSGDGRGSEDVVDRDFLDLLQIADGIVRGREGEGAAAGVEAGGEAAEGCTQSLLQDGSAVGVQWGGKDGMLLAHRDELGFANLDLRFQDTSKNSNTELLTNARGQPLVLR